MKKGFVLLVIFIVLGAFFLMLILKNKQNIDTEINLKGILQERVYTLNHESIKIKDIWTNRKILIVFYDSDCDICHIEAKEFERLKEEFNDCQVLFLSNNSFEETSNFITQNGLTHSQFVFLFDKDNSLMHKYEISSIPFMILYVNNKLIKTYKGVIKVERIITDKGEK